MADCIFCKIIKGEIPGKFIYRDDQLVSFYDINPKAPIHVLIVPVVHLQSLQEVKKRDEELLGKMMVMVNKLAQKIGIAKSGYKVIINNGEASGQLVPHLHLHIVGGWREGVHWQV